MKADIDEEAENYEDYEFEEGLEVQLNIDDEALQAARHEEISFMEVGGAGAGLVGRARP